MAKASFLTSRREFEQAQEAQSAACLNRTCMEVGWELGGMEVGWELQKKSYTGPIAVQNADKLTAIQPISAHVTWHIVRFIGSHLGAKGLFCTAACVADSCLTYSHPIPTLPTHFHPIRPFRHISIPSDPSVRVALVADLPLTISLVDLLQISLC